MYIRNISIDNKKEMTEMPNQFISITHKRQIYTIYNIYIDYSLQWRILDSWYIISRENGYSAKKITLGKLISGLVNFINLLMYYFIEYYFISYTIILLSLKFIRFCIRIHNNFYIIHSITINYNWKFVKVSE